MKVDEGDRGPGEAPGMRLPWVDRLLALGFVALMPISVLLIVIHVAWGFFVAGLLFPVLPTRARDSLVQFWSRMLLVILGIRLELHGAPDLRESAARAPGRGLLLAVNHISWVDVFVIAAVVPARFVAKAEIANWPLLGGFAASVGTVFVERGRRHAVAHVNHVVASRLRTGQIVGIFPEGTTTDGSRLLRFHANVVQAALDAEVPVVPIALQYRQDDHVSDAAAFVGEMNLVQSIGRVLLAPRLRARMHWLPMVDWRGGTRHAIAGRARAAIAGALALPDAETAVETAADAELAQAAADVPD